jgi:hypothetical protein
MFDDLRVRVSSLLRLQNVLKQPALPRPMPSVIDAKRLWRLVDGTGLAFREGLAPAKSLKKGLQGLDNLQLVRVVLNEVSEFSRADHYDQYCAHPKHRKNSPDKNNHTEVVA